MDDGLQTLFDHLVDLSQEVRRDLDQAGRRGLDGISDNVDGIRLLDQRQSTRFVPST
jgi:hypothetical protein